MSRTQSESPARRRVRASNTPPDTPTSAAPTTRRRSATATPQSDADAGTTPVASGERDRMIAQAAYYRAERRGFAGDEGERQQDWLEAEAEIDRAIASGARGNGGN